MKVRRLLLSGVVMETDEAEKVLLRGYCGTGKGVE